ncbi:MAG: PilZ domain-containing protein [Candidatus Eisenbacteria bacterium]|nr:PilZ domain-containing protein [Candidatus Eisenbacteria bacterium]
MTKSDARSDRRRNPRVEARLALQISERGAKGGPQVAESLNISTGGVYCLVKAALPVLTVLDLSIQLPKFGANKATQVLHCEAVVVRCEKSAKPARGAVVYDLACAFQNLDDETQGMVNEYVLWKLLRPGTTGNG